LGHGFEAGKGGKNEVAVRTEAARHPQSVGVIGCGHDVRIWVEDWDMTAKSGFTPANCPVLFSSMDSGKSIETRSGGILANAGRTVTLAPP
jgi:hypothetical protein